MLLREALEQIPGMDLTRNLRNLDVHINGISYDSRLVQKGNLFVAIKGEKTDGALFVEQAIERGAAAVASEQPLKPELQVVSFIVPDARSFLAAVSRIYYEDPAARLKLVGITGTNGKTTTSWIMDSIYSHTHIRSCLAGTLGMKIGTQIYPCERTTPEASDLTRFLHQAVADGCTHGVMEVSSHALVLKRVFGTKFAVGVFMNLTRDHLDFHKDMEAYFQAKQLFFSPENGNQIEAAVINTDDPYGKRLEKELQCPVLRFGFSRLAEIHVLDYQSSADGTDLDLVTPKGRIRYHSRLIGRPNVCNIMAATGAALFLGLDIEQIRGGVQALKEVPGRLELVDAGQDFSVIVDYAHSPDALENLLKTVSQIPHAKIITVFGCGGDRDRSKRPIMGDIAVKMSDLVIVTSDNPRSEDPLDILREIECGMQTGPEHYEIIPDRRQAIDHAVSIARKGDIVVIAGKGHENYQIIGSRRIWFDDREQARELIRQRTGLEQARKEPPTESLGFR